MSGVRTVTWDEIMALKGPNLNVAVAERVMGWLGRPKWFDGTPIMLAPVGEGKFTPMPVPHYSEDLNASWQVVERMRDWGYGVNMGADRSAMSDAWAVDFYGPFETGCHYKVVAAPLAVAACRAALLAVCGEGLSDARA